MFETRFNQDPSELPFARCVPVVLAASAALPRREEIGDLLKNAETAAERGYFFPDEDERLFEVYSRYLSIRSSLLDCIHAIAGTKLSTHATGGLASFSVAFAAACILVRSANFIVELAMGNPVVRYKLDAPEPRFSLPPKSFTTIYKSLTSPRRWGRFFEAMRYFEANESAVLQLRERPELTEIIDRIMEEVPYVQRKEQDFLAEHLRYRLHSFWRRNRSGYRKAMFHLFKMSGSAIADMKQPFVKPRGSGKRVDDSVRERLDSFLRAGDVVVTRHLDAVSNLFLPGFWPHAVLYIGSANERAALGVDEDVAPKMRFVEAKKDGVRWRPAEETLAVDALVVLRPQLSAEARADAIKKSLTHVGKLYDFGFDFRISDRLACTELVYRSYHGVGDVRFELRAHSGRLCLSAEDLMNQAISGGWFEPVLVFGVGTEGWVEGSAARACLRGSYRAGF